MTDHPHGPTDPSGRPADQQGKPLTAPRDDLRRHVTAACRRWKPTWDRTSQLPADMVTEIIAAADAYALAYARDCLAAVAHAHRDTELAKLLGQLAGTTTPQDRNTNMSVRYWVLVHDEVMKSDPQWPEGLRVIEPGPYNQPAHGQPPAARWWIFEDDGAPATLEGKAVELTFTRCADKIQIGSRNPAL